MASESVELSHTFVAATELMDYYKPSLLVQTLSGLTTVFGIKDMLSSREEEDVKADYLIFKLRPPVGDDQRKMIEYE